VAYLQKARRQADRDSEIENHCIKWNYATSTMLGETGMKILQLCNIYDVEEREINKIAIFTFATGQEV